MMKLFLSSAIAMVGLSVMAGDAKAQAVTPIPVLQQCPQATWTNGFHIWELIPLNPNQYKTAVVSGDGVQVRNGAGVDTLILNTLNKGAQVIVTGEAWDMACNQWTQISYRGGFAWIHGDYLILL